MVIDFVCSLLCQTFKSYTNIPLMSIMRAERGHFGFFGFYAAGIPVWATSLFLSISRNHFLDLPLDYLQSAISSLSDNDRYKSCVNSVFSGVTFL
jgi:hypothetical protein